MVHMCTHANFEKKIDYIFTLDIILKGSNNDDCRSMKIVKIHHYYF